MDASPLLVPFVIAIDDREKLPYGFTDLRADARQGRRPLIVRTQTQRLWTGDYGVVGLLGVTAVERKSLSDLFSTLGQGRERFEAELARLNDLPAGGVVAIEADWPTILRDPPGLSQLNPKTIHRSVIAWRERYPRVHFWPMGNRRLAEITTFRVLERAWKSCGRLNETGTEGAMEGVES